MRFRQAPQDRHRLLFRLAVNTGCSVLLASLIATCGASPRAQGPTSNTGPTAGLIGTDSNFPVDEKGPLNREQRPKVLIEAHVWQVPTADAVEMLKRWDASKEIQRIAALDLTRVTLVQAQEQLILCKDAKRIAAPRLFTRVGHQAACTVGSETPFVIGYDKSGLPVVADSFEGINLSLLPQTAEFDARDSKIVYEIQYDFEIKSVTEVKDVSVDVVESGKKVVKTAQRPILASRTMKSAVRIKEGSGIVLFNGPLNRDGKSFQILTLLRLTDASDALESFAGTLVKVSDPLEVKVLAKAIAMLDAIKITYKVDDGIQTTPKDAFISQNIIEQAVKLAAIVDKNEPQPDGSPALRLQFDDTPIELATITTYRREGDEVLIIGANAEVDFKNYHIDCNEITIKATFAADRITPRLTNLQMTGSVVSDLSDKSAKRLITDRFEIGQEWLISGPF